jgi:hypothetical protein
MSDLSVEKIITATKEDLRAFGKSSVEDMADAARHAAYQIESVERRRLLEGWTTSPNVDAMQYVVRLDDLSNFLDAVLTRPHEVARRLNSMARR